MVTKRGLRVLATSKPVYVGKEEVIVGMEKMIERIKQEAV
jgi:hypothetical protein